MRALSTSAQTRAASGALESYVCRNMACERWCLNAFAKVSWVKALEAPAEAKEALGTLFDTYVPLPMT